MGKLLSFGVGLLIYEIWKDSACNEAAHFNVFRKKTKVGGGRHTVPVMALW